MKLNGWQRIGVVLSILWILPVGGFPLIQLWNYPNPHMDLGINNSPLFDWIEDRSEVKPGSQFIPLNPKLKFGLYLLISFGPVFSVWPLAYLFIFTLRWVTAGFKQRT